MTNKVTIYEPNLCCSSGVCGPNPDQALIRLQDTIAKIKELGVETQRFTITSHPREFTRNPEVMKLLQQNQLEALPITEIDGKIVKTGSYPSLEELRSNFT
ncbi:MAG: arsenite efflux transporter metallochaperone ArsD [Dehalococcoidaceae bacterium]|nr:arsenite efflux transporter metallochaperone ArsD [Dehalococcoidaceae bacterium]